MNNGLYHGIFMVEKKSRKCGIPNKEFSHVNGPKDQAGGCLAGLLFSFINVRI